VQIRDSRSWLIWVPGMSSPTPYAAPINCLYLFSPPLPPSPLMRPHLQFIVFITTLPNTLSKITPYSMNSWRRCSSVTFVCKPFTWQTRWPIDTTCKPTNKWRNSLVIQGVSLVLQMRGGATKLSLPEVVPKRYRGSHQQALKAARWPLLTARSLM